MARIYEDANIPALVLRSSTGAPSAPTNNPDDYKLFVDTTDTDYLLKLIDSSGTVYQIATGSSTPSTSAPDDAAYILRVANPFLSSAQVLSTLQSGRMFVTNGTGVITSLKDNLNAAVDPVATNDTTQGYAAGSIWINTVDNKAFICKTPIASAAVWLPMSGSTEVVDGGTGFTSYAKGDLLVGNSSNTLSKLGFTGIPDGYVLTKVSGEVAWQPPSGGAPSDAPYITEGSVTGLSNERPLSSIISSSNFGSRPAATSEGGRLFFPTDAAVISRDTASSWHEWGTIYPLTPPTNAGTWSWLNQATGTVTEGSSQIVLKAETFNATGSGGWETSGRFISAPTAPYSVAMAYKWVFQGWESESGAPAAPCFFFRKSSTGELDIYAMVQSYQKDWVISPRYVSALNEDTSSAFETSYTAIRSLLGQQLVWVRITDNATTISWDFSLDGQYWIPITSGNARLAGYDQIGFGFTSQRQSSTWANQYGYLWLHHWRVS